MIKIQRYRLEIFTPFRSQSQLLPSLKVFFEINSKRKTKNKQRIGFCEQYKLSNQK